MTIVGAKVTKLVVVRSKWNPEIIDVYAALNINSEQYAAIIIKDFASSEIGITTFTIEMGTLLQIDIDDLFSTGDSVKTAISPLDAKVYAFTIPEPMQVKLVGTSLQVGDYITPSSVSYPDDNMNIIPMEPIRIKLTYTEVE